MGRVVVLGASLIDMNIRLPLLPAPGETRLGGSFFSGPGGKGANQAVAARRAGAEVVFLTAFGGDAFADQIRRHDEREGIDLRHAKVIPAAASGVAMIFVDEGGDNLIGVAMGANAGLGPDDIDALPDEVFGPPGVFLASLEVPIETVARGIERARRSGLAVVVNPAPADPRLVELGSLPRIDVLTPNEGEARTLAGAVPEDPADALRARGVGAVVVTLGAAGCLVVDRSGRTSIPARRVEVVDTVGAGDAFSAALAVALSEGRPLREAAAWATAAAALAVTRPGAQGGLATRAAIDAMAGARPDPT